MTYQTHSARLRDLVEKFAGLDVEVEIGSQTLTRLLDVLEAARAENEWFIQKHDDGLVRVTEHRPHTDDCLGLSPNTRYASCPHLEVLTATATALGALDDGL